MYLDSVKRRKQKINKINSNNASCIFFLLLRLIKTVPKIMRISENNNLKQITTYQFQYISPIPWYIFVFTFVNIINIKW